MRKFIILFIFFVLSNNSFAESKIVYLDINLLLNESIVGQNLNKKLKEINNKNITEFKTIETNIKKEDDDLLKKKKYFKQRRIWKRNSFIKKKIQIFSKLNEREKLKIK